jgi:hypothetical protein
MSSLIADIYGTFSSDITPLVDGVPPAVRSFDQLRENVQSADCPVRLLLTTTGETQGQAAFLTLGKLQTIQWTLEDLLLWRPAGQSEGLRRNSDKLMLYIRSYLDEIRFNRAPTAQSHIQSVRCIPAMVEWPQGSGELYYGVRCIVEIQEIVSAASYADKVRATSPGNLIGYWPMSEASGATAFDLSPEGNDGAYTGVTLGQRPGIGDGRTVPLFDGANDFNNIYSAAFNTDFNGAEGTMAVWGKVSGVGVWTDGDVRSLFHIKVDGGNLVYIVKDSNNNVQCAYIAGGTTEVENFASTDTEWMHFAIVWSSAGDTVDFYKNGVAGTQDTVLGTFAGDLDANNCNIGARVITPTWPWDGFLAHAAVWKTALTGAQISRLAQV